MSETTELAVINISTEKSLDTLTELVRTLGTEIQDAVAQSSRGDRNASKKITDIPPTAEIVAVIALPRQDREEKKTLPNLKNLTGPTSGTPHKTATTSEIAPKFASHTKLITRNEIKSPVDCVAMRKSAKIKAESIIPAVRAKHASIVAKLAISGTNAVLDAKTLTESTRISTKQLLRELKKPPTNGVFELKGG